jgi:hypothetical protein
VIGNLDLCLDHDGILPSLPGAPRLPGGPNSAPANTHQAHQSRGRGAAWPVGTGEA